MPTLGQALKREAGGRSIPHPSQFEVKPAPSTEPLLSGENCSEQGLSLEVHRGRAERGEEMVN